MKIFKNITSMLICSLVIIFIIACVGGCQKNKPYDVPEQEVENNKKDVYATNVSAEYTEEEYNKMGYTKEDYNKFL